MADRLAESEDLASLLERDDIDAYKAGVLIEIATAVVQGAAGNQRIVLVTDDVVSNREGERGIYLDLPQIPVVSVALVTMDGVPITDYKLFGNRLRRHCGWWSATGAWRRDPATIGFVYTHGFATGAQDLQRGRGAALSLCKGAFPPGGGGLTAESIDDYSATFDALQAQMDASPFLAEALRKQYGRRAGAVRIG